MTDFDHFLIHADAGAGLQSVADAAMDPFEALARKEDGEEPVSRSLVLRRLVIFLHADSLHPGEWARRWFALAALAHPTLVMAVDVDVWQRDCLALDIFAQAAVMEIRARRVGANRSLLDAQGLEPGHSKMSMILPDVMEEEWRSVLRRLLEDLASTGMSPPEVAKRCASYAQTLAHPMLLMASCEEIGRLFGQTRAAVSWRAKEVFTRRIEAAGGVGHAPFQKGSEVSEKYREAQMGNRNRKGREKRRKGRKSEF